MELSALISMYLPGCTSAGASKKEIEQNIIEAIKLHLDVLAEENLPIPEPSSQSEMVEVS